MVLAVLDNESKFSVTATPIDVMAIGAEGAAGACFVALLPRFTSKRCVYFSEADARMFVKHSAWIR